MRWDINSLCFRDILLCMFLRLSCLLYNGGWKTCSFGVYMVTRFFKTFECLTEPPLVFYFYFLILHGLKLSLALLCSNSLPLSLKLIVKCSILYALFSTWILARYSCQVHTILPFLEGNFVFLACIPFQPSFSLLVWYIIHEGWSPTRPLWPC